MSEQNIYLKDVLQQMKTLDSEGKAVPFSIKVRTYNRYTKTGGKLNSYPKAKMVLKEEYGDPYSVKSLLSAPKKVVERKKPNHFTNKTRNIKLPNGQIKKIHIRFIIEFNNKKVIY